MSEELLRDAVGLFASSGKNIVEVGAGLGNITVHLSEYAGPEGSVISYEAITQRAEFVREVIRYCGLNNIKHIGLKGDRPTIDDPLSGTEYFFKDEQHTTFPSQVVIRNVVVGTQKYDLPNEIVGPHMHPRELPQCDCLVLDCDGAEIEILTNMDSVPDTVVVEHHALNGEAKAKPFEYQPDTIVNLLRDRNYEIVHTRTAKPASEYGELETVLVAQQS